MRNPLVLSRETGQPFVYWHTYKVDDASLNAAIQSRKSIELDISRDDDGVFFKPGTFYIGHPPLFYTELGHTFHDNVPLEEAVGRLEQHPDVFVVLDCKRGAVMEKTEQIIQRLGAERCLFHAFLEEGSFRPFSEDVDIAPHWDEEDIPLKDVVEIKKRTGVPVIGACRGLVSQKLNHADAVDSLLSTVNGTGIDCVSLYMPGSELPDLDLTRRIADAGYFNWFNVDKMDDQDISGILYIGMSDHLERASAWN